MQALSHVRISVNKHTTVSTGMVNSCIIRHVLVG